MCSMRRGAIALPLISIFFLAGCSDAETGSASPATHGADISTATDKATPESGSKDGSPIEQTDPCSLLDVSDLGRFGEFGPGEYRDYGTGRNCRWQADRDGASEKVPLVDLIIEDEAGIDLLPDLGGGLQSGKANSGRSIVRTSNEDGCVVAMAVGERARVDVIVSMVELDSACSITDELVDIIDEKLPLG